MNATAPAPGSPEHLALVTASKVAAILGVSKWESPYSLWMEMKGRTTREPTSTVQARGNYLEPAILAWWFGQHPEYDMTETQPYFTLGDWAAATPDAIGLGWDAVNECSERVLVEAKSASRLDDWDNDGEDGTSIDGVPIYYWVQIQWQMHVSGVDRAYLALIGTFLEFKEYVIEYDATHSGAVEAHCREFFDSLAADEPPPLDGSVATYDVLRKQYDGIDKDLTVELEPAVAVEYVDAVNDAKDSAERERLAKSTLLDLMGDAAYADCDHVRIARRQAGKGAASLRQVAKTTDELTTTKDAA